MCGRPKVGCIWQSVLDLSRAVVGWATHHRMQQALVHAALEMAIARRQPKEEVLLHSDRGSQYCAYDYQALLRRHRIVPSHSRPGNCWDTQFTILLNVSPI
ncbi:DDE-type integrase/transposase/recombinase [Pseudomonas aeruginosa]